jgi:hypothetical protein
MTSQQLEERSQQLEARVATLEAELAQIKQLLLGVPGGKRWRVPLQILLNLMKQNA